MCGVLRGFDPFMNLVMDECMEETKQGEKHSIGMVVSLTDSSSTTDFSGHGYQSQDIRDSWPPTFLQQGNSKQSFCECGSESLISFCGSFLII